MSSHTSVSSESAVLPSPPPFPWWPAPPMLRLIARLWNDSAVAINYTHTHTTAYMYLVDEPGHSRAVLHPTAHKPHGDDLVCQDYNVGRVPRERERGPLPGHHWSTHTTLTVLLTMVIPFVCKTSMSYWHLKEQLATYFFWLV